MTRQLRLFHTHSYSELLNNKMGACRGTNMLDTLVAVAASLLGGLASALAGAFVWVGSLLNAESFYIAIAFFYISLVMFYMTYRTARAVRTRA